MKEREDYLIISDVLNGDMDAYAVLVKRYQKQIFGLMKRLTLNEEDALDLTQETFIKAYNKLENFKPSGNFFAWLYTIGINNARDFLRKRKVRQIKSGEIYESNKFLMENGIAEKNAIDIIDAKIVQKAIERLPLDYREALFLRFRDDMSIKEIAECLNLSISATKMRIHRGLTKLREIISKVASQ